MEPSSTQFFGLNRETVYSHRVFFKYCKMFKTKFESKIKVHNAQNRLRILLCLLWKLALFCCARKMSPIFLILLLSRMKNSISSLFRYVWIQRLIIKCEPIEMKWSNFHSNEIALSKTTTVRTLNQWYMIIKRRQLRGWIKSFGVATFAVIWNMFVKRSVLLPRYFTLDPYRLNKRRSLVFKSSIYIMTIDKKANQQ